MPVHAPSRLAVREWLKANEAVGARYRAETAVEQVLLPCWPREQLPRDLQPFAAKSALYDLVRTSLGDQPITYLEFGVYRGWSLFEIAKRFSHTASRFVGFDSFTGLPERWKDMDKGTFDRRGQPPPATDDRISFQTGWFQDTLPAFLENNEPLDNRIVLVHFDADLYSATLFVLSVLWMNIPSYYFVFDEFMSDEIVAFSDFISAFPVRYELLAQTNGGGYPSQVFGRLQRSRLQDS